jgi:transcriptional regulator with XRE-family HTH domain
MLRKINKERKKMIIENIMKENKINLTEVSKELGISKSYTSMLLSGDRKASINLLKKVTLISTMYLQEDCSLFKRHLQNILGIQDKRRFDRIMDNIYPLLVDNGEKVTQKKVLEVRKQTEERSNKARNSAKARWNKPQTYKSKVYNKPKVVKQGPIPTLSAAQRARKMLNDGYE